VFCDIVDACDRSPKGREVSVVSAQFYFFLVGEHRWKSTVRQEFCLYSPVSQGQFAAIATTGTNVKGLY
jgi:hypothetical protein